MGTPLEEDYDGKEKEKVFITQRLHKKFKTVTQLVKKKKNDLSRARMLQ